MMSDSSGGDLSDVDDFDDIKMIMQQTHHPHPPHFDFFRVRPDATGLPAGAYNDLTVLNNSSLFDDLLDDIAPVAPFECNGVTFEKGYYLADDIYPQWSSFVKSFTVANSEKNTSFKRKQESARKDVERAFGGPSRTLAYYMVLQDSIDTRMRNYSEKISAMANTTPIVTTVTKTATKKKTPNGAETASRINILDFCEEHYEDILSVMDKILRDKRREVHTRLDFGENSRKSQRIREDSQNSSAKTLFARYRNPSERPQTRDRLGNNDGNMFGRLGHQRKSAFKRLRDTYSPNATKSGPDRKHSRDDSYSRGLPHKRNSSPSRDRPRSRDRSQGIEESYGNTYSFYRTGDKHRRTLEVKVKKGKPIDEEDLAVPWSCEEVDPFTPRIRNFKSSQKIRMPNSVKNYDGTGDPEDHVKIFQAATQQKKYVKVPIEIHNIKQKDGETIKDFIKRFNVETGRVKGAPKCIRISGFMHGVNNPELTKCLNEHVSKTLEEMMTATVDFIRRETAAASKKKAHTPWKLHDQPKRQNSERRSNFRNQPKDGRGNKFCEFHNDKGHNTDECVQLKKQIEELLRAGKLSHFIKEIRRDRDQQKIRKKDDPVKDKVAAIYMIQPWQIVTRQKVTQSFAHVKEITFPLLTANKETGGPLVIEAKISGHALHRIYVDGGTSMEVLVKVLKEKSIQEEEVATVVEEEGPTWMTPIMEYLKDGTLLGDKKKASKLRIKARPYELFEGVLYRRSFLKPWLRKGQVFDSRYGLFHKVDRGESRGNNHRQSGEEVHVGQHSVPLRSSKRNSLGPRLSEGIKACLDEGNKNWIKELPHVLWAHQIEMPTYCTAVVDAVHNNEELQLNLELLEERRECAADRQANAKLKMTKYYNTRVSGVTFRPRDFVYRSNEACHAMDGEKLGPKWKDPMRSLKPLEMKHTG
nr:reverse transcriptase domain-containing protein [Tanacetum cinerariifolium]